MSVRIAPEQGSPDSDSVDAMISRANAFARSGASAVHVSAGPGADPAACADRIRNQAGREVGVAVIAAGSISAPDVSTIVLAGHADLCVVDQPKETSPWLSPRGASDRLTLSESP